MKCEPACYFTEISLLEPDDQQSPIILDVKGIILHQHAYQYHRAKLRDKREPLPQRYHPNSVGIGFRQRNVPGQYYRTLAHTKSKLSISPHVRT